MCVSNIIIYTYRAASDYIFYHAQLRYIHTLFSRRFVEHTAFTNISTCSPYTTFLSHIHNNYVNRIISLRCKVGEIAILFTRRNIILLKLLEQLIFWVS